MTLELQAVAATSRPKIHRPPVFSPPARGAGQRLRRPMLLGAGLVLSCAGLLALVSGFTTLLDKQIKTGQPMIPAEDTVVEVASQQKVYIDDGGQSIVGQMMRMPLDDHPAAEVETMSEVDRREGQELLSIVSQH